MKVVALISGGKDSCFNMMQCVAEGHDIIALANLRPKDKDEIDSYMYQTVGHESIDLYAEAMGLPLFRRTIEGASVEIGRDYSPNKADEVEDLYLLLKQIKETHVYTWCKESLKNQFEFCSQFLSLLHLLTQDFKRDELSIEGVSCGAILSNYQRVRVESVCARLGLVSLAYLWRRDQDELMSEMLACNVNAVLIKVATMGLLPDKHLGLTLEEIHPHMMAMKIRYGLNMCGEGGEYETFTLDCPLFKKKIVVDKMSTVIHSDDAFAPVGYLKFEEMHLEDKKMDPSLSMFARVKNLPMKRSAGLFDKLFSTNSQTPPPHALDRSFSIDHKIQTDFEHTTESFVPPVLIQSTKEKLWVSGISAVVTENSDSIEDATQKAMEQLKDVIIKSGFNMADLVVVHLYVKDMDTFSLINSVYTTYFSVNPPARVCVQVDLPGSVALQLDCYVRKTTETSTRSTMHVQGLSHWAPANIGPYSQAVMTNETIFIAGQIPLCPANLKLVVGGIIPQARLSLQHVHNVLVAMSEESTLQNVVLTICYVTNAAYIQHAEQEWATQVYIDEQSNHVYQHELSRSGILECVVVPSLPRGALIEWQTICFTPRKSFEKTSSQHVTDTFKIQKEVCLVKNGLNFDLVFKVNLGLLDTENYSCRFESMVEETLKQVGSVLDFPRTYDAITFLTVFYNQKLVQISRLEKVFTAFFLKEDIQVPSVAYVPVMGFSSHRQLLSIVH